MKLPDAIEMVQCHFFFLFKKTDTAQVEGLRVVDLTQVHVWTAFW